MKALEVRIRKVRKGDIDRIIDIERSWHHLSHWSIDSYYRLLNDDSFTSSFVAEIEDDNGRLNIVGFVIFHIAADVSEIYNIAVENSNARSGILRNSSASSGNTASAPTRRRAACERDVAACCALTGAQAPDRSKDPHRDRRVAQRARES